MELIQTKCLPIILYGLDACPVNAADNHSLDFVLNRSLMKLFQTGSICVINECRNAFNIQLLSERVRQRKTRFLTKFSVCNNSICALFAKVAAAQLSEIGGQFAHMQ